MSSADILLFLPLIFRDNVLFLLFAASNAVFRSGQKHHNDTVLKYSFPSPLSIKRLTYPLRERVIVGALFPRFAESRSRKFRWEMLGVIFIQRSEHADTGNDTTFYAQ